MAGRAALSGSGQRGAWEGAYGRGAGVDHSLDAFRTILQIGDGEASTRIEFEIKSKLKPGLWGMELRSPKLSM